MSTFAIFEIPPPLKKKSYDLFTEKLLHIKQPLKTEICIRKGATGRIGGYANY